MPRISPTPRSGDTPRARALGQELRAAREAIEPKLTTRALGERLGGRANSTIVRWENGHVAPSVADTAAVLQELGVTGDDRDRILELAAEVADPNWLAPGIDQQLGMLIDYERTAEDLTEVNLTVPPGLLQTPEFARSIMRADGLAADQAVQRVMLRMARRDVLTGPRRKPFLALVGEYAVRHLACPRNVALPQLQALLHWGEQDNITIQVIPYAAAWTPAHVGPFMLLTFDRTGDVVVVEHYRSSATITDRQDVADYRAAVDVIRGAAMSPEESARLIAEVVTEMEQ